MAVGPHAHLADLVNGTIQPDGIKLEQVEVRPITMAFRRMCRTMDYDITEMAVCTYLAAKDLGKPFTALPIYPVAHSQHGGIYYNVNAGVKSPKDLEGKTVGARAWTLTPAVWQRGILETEYGVDLSKLRHILADEEHVLEFHNVTPANCERRVGADLGAMLESGEIAAITGGRFDSPNIKQLIPDAEKAAEEYTKRTGIDPLDHFLVVKDELLAEHPWIGPALFEACKAAKASFQKSNGGDGHHGHDPMPIGMKGTRHSLDPLLKFSADQKVTSRLYSADEIFASNTLNLE
jgi:4,5-dihydroxyphthalate decarboxylase